MLTLLGGLLALAPATAVANNTTFGEAYSLVVGGTPAEGFVDPTNPERWYISNVTAGRSYCVETQGGVHFDNQAGHVDTVLVVYDVDHVDPASVATTTSRPSPWGTTSRVSASSPP